MAPVAAREANRLHAEALRLAVQERKITILTSTKCISIEDNGVVVESDCTITTLPADTVVYCVGMRSNSDPYCQLYDCAGEVYRVGDCVKPGTVREAILTGYYTAAEI